MWDRENVVYYEVLKMAQIITVKVYSQKLNRFAAAIKKNCSYLANRWGVVLHHDHIPRISPRRRSENWVEKSWPTSHIQQISHLQFIICFALSSTSLIRNHFKIQMVSKKQSLSSSPQSSLPSIGKVLKIWCKVEVKLLKEMAIIYLIEVLKLFVKIDFIFVEKSVFIFRKSQYFMWIIYYIINKMCPQWSV